MHRHNWRRAASYIYQYAARLRAELILKDHQHVSLVLQERLNALSASINALNLVHPAYAWIDPLHEGNSLQNECYPSKKAKKTVEEQCKYYNKKLLLFVDPFFYICISSSPIWNKNFHLNSIQLIFFSNFLVNSILFNLKKIF